MAGTDWVFKLRDQMTGPAGSIESQLRRVTGALKQLDMQAKLAQIARTLDPLRKQRLELGLQRDKLLLSKRALDDHSRSNTSASKSWSDSLLRWAGSLYILDTVRRAFGAVGRAALGMGDQVKDAVQTQQRQLFGLRENIGGRAGGQMFRSLQKQAQLYGRPDVVGIGAQFAALGAPPALTGAMVAAQADVQAKGRGDITEQLSDLLRHPVGSVGQLESFSTALGGDPNRLRDVIARKHSERSGKVVRRGDVDTILGQNNIPAFLMQESVLEALQGAGGGRMLGAAATDFANKSLPGSIGRVQSSLQQLFGSLENSRGIKTLQEVMQNLATTLGSKAVRTSLTDLANTLGDALKPLTGAEGRKRMEDFFTSMAKKIQETLPTLRDLIDSMMGLGRWYANIFKLLAPGTSQSERMKAADAVLNPVKDLLGWDKPLMTEEEIARATASTSAGRILPRTTPQSPFAPTRGQKQLSVGQVLVQVDARGASRDDAQAIGDAVAEAAKREFNTMLERLATEQGATP